MKFNATHCAIETCPACASDRYQVVGRQASGFLCADAVGLQHPAYYIRECETCCLHYKSDVLSASSLDVYYAKLDFTPFNTNHQFPTDSALLAHLRSLSIGSSVLDFGCNTGRILTELGDNYLRFGVEINEAAANEARRKGITILTDADLEGDNARTFDAIVLSDVFEHLLAPTAVLSRLAALLVPGGGIVFVTGLADAVEPRALLAESWYFRIGGHLQMMSRRHLNWLAATLGLEIASVEVMSHYKREPVRYVKQQLQSALYRSFKLAPSSAMACTIRAVPGLRRAEQWTNLPSTDQCEDHVVAVLRNQ